jgi:hopanoid biosynthesis associated RND transporter like protein HpnN
VFGRILIRLQTVILDRPVAVLAVSALLAAVCLVFGTGLLGPGVEFRTSRAELAPSDDPEQKRLDRLVREVGGNSVLIVCVEREDSSATSLADLKRFTDTLAAELAAEPVVGRVFFRVPLDWFLQRSFYLVPDEMLRELADELGRNRESLGFLADMSGLTELNNTLAEGMEKGLANASTPPPEASSGVSYLLTFLESERRFLEDSDAFVNDLEVRPPLLILADRPGLAAEGYVTTRDGTETFLIASPLDPDDSLPALRRFVRSLRAVVERISAQQPGFVVGFTGQPAMTVEEMDTIRRDTWFTSAVALIGVTLLTMLVFRWKTHAWLVLGALASGVLWTFGWVAVQFGYLNLVTSSFISTLIGVGVAYMIHPVSEYELEGAHSGDPVAAVRKAYHRTGPPVTVAAVTTSAAFLSIQLMNFRGFAELGLVAGVGVILCLLASLVMLPAALVVYGRRRRRRDRESRKSSASAAVDRFWVERGAAQVTRFPRAVTVAAVIVTLLLAWAARGIGFNTNLFDLLPKNSESLQYQRRLVMESDLSPVSAMAVAEDFDDLRLMKAVAEAEPSIRRFESVLQFLPQDPEASRDAARALGRLFDDLSLPRNTSRLDRVELEKSLVRLHDAIEASSESAFGAGMGELAGSLEQARADVEAAGLVVSQAPAGAEATWDRDQRRLLDWVHRLLDDLKRAAAAAPPTLDDLPASIHNRFVTSEGRFIAYLQPEGDVFDPEVLKVYVNAARRVAPQVTGFPIVFHHVSEQITSGFYRAVAVGAVLVLLILLIDYRNFADAALAVIPLAMGVVWMMGLMGLAGLDFNFANLVAIPLIIGIGIDNGVHVIHRVRLEGEAGMTVVLRHTGRAILIASLTTMIGFGSLALASHQGLASLGKVLLLGVGSCLVTSTLILPNILVAFGKTRG